MRNYDDKIAFIVLALIVIGIFVPPIGRLVCGLLEGLCRVVGAILGGYFSLLFFGGAIFGVLLAVRWLFGIGKK